MIKKFPEAIYRRLDFGIDLSNDCEIVPEGDTSAPVSPVKKAARRSPRLAIKSLKNLLSKKRNQFE